MKHLSIIGALYLIVIFTGIMFAIRDNHPLMEAAKRGDLAEIEEQLMVYDINDVDSKGNTALHYAAKTGHYDVVETLVDHGAEVNYINKKAEVPIVLAIRFRREPVVAYLLSLPQINIDIRDDAGLTPRNYLRSRLRFGKTFLKQYDIARLSQEQIRAIEERERELKAEENEWVLVEDNE